MKLWKEDLGKVNKKAADSLADPSEYENLFPEFQEALQAEKVTVKLRANGRNNSQNCWLIFVVVACYLLATWPCTCEWNMSIKVACVHQLKLLLPKSAKRN